MTVSIWTAVVVVILIFLRVSNIFRYIPNDQVGIVEKMWAAKGSIKSGFIALDGEAGFEPEILRGGLHVFFPFTKNAPLAGPVVRSRGRQTNDLTGHSRPTLSC